MPISPEVQGPAPPSFFVRRVSMSSVFLYSDAHCQLNTGEPPPPLCGAKFQTLTAP